MTESEAPTNVGEDAHTGFAIPEGSAQADDAGMVTPDISENMIEGEDDGGESADDES